MKFRLEFTLGMWQPGTVHILKEAIENILRLANAQTWSWVTVEKP